MTFYVCFDNSVNSAKLLKMWLTLYFRFQSKPTHIELTNFEWQGEGTETNLIGKYDRCI